MIRNTVVKIIFFSLLCASIPSLFGMEGSLKKSLDGEFEVFLLLSFEEKGKGIVLAPSTDANGRVIPNRIDDCLTRDVQKQIQHQLLEKWSEDNDFKIQFYKNVIIHNSMYSSSNVKLDYSDVLFYDKQQLVALNVMFAAQYSAAGKPHIVSLLRGCSVRTRNGVLTPETSEELFNAALSLKSSTKEKFIPKGNEDLCIFVPKKGAVVQKDFSLPMIGLTGAGFGVGLYSIVGIPKSYLTGELGMDRTHLAWCAGAGFVAFAGGAILNDLRKNREQVPAAVTYDASDYEKRSLFTVDERFKMKAKADAEDALYGIQAEGERIKMETKYEQFKAKHKFDERKWQRLILPKE